MIQKHLRDKLANDDVLNSSKIGDFQQFRKKLDRNVLEPKVKNIMHLTIF
jgi:hypothetical protein